VAFAEAGPFSRFEAAIDLAVSFWDEVARYLPEWQAVRDGKVSSGEIRQGFIHCHGIALHALGHVGNYLLLTYPDNWKTKLKPLRKIDWSRTNSALWEGRAMIGGRLSKATPNVVLTSVAIKNALGLPATPEEGQLEQARRRSLNAR